MTMTAGAGTAAIALTDKIQFFDNKYQIEEGVNLGNLELAVLQIDHRDIDWEDHSGEIKRMLATHQLVIPEYFPPEYAQLNQDPNPLVSNPINNYNKDNALFSRVAEETFKNQSSIYVVDPAYSLAFGNLREMILMSGVMSVAGIFGVIAKSDSMSRRTLIKSTMLTLLGVVSGSIFSNFLEEADHTPENDLENDFRHVIIAESLQQFGDRLPERTSALLIYPSPHWEAIKNYLNDQGARKARLNIYRQLPPFSSYEDFWVNRLYSPIPSGWQKTGEHHI